MRNRDKNGFTERRKFLAWLLSGAGLAVTSMMVPIRKGLKKAVFAALPIKKLKEEDLHRPHDLAG